MPAANARPEVVDSAMVQALIEKTMAGVQLKLHRDIQNMHIDMIRQFHIQKVSRRCLSSTPDHARQRYFPMLTARTPHTLTLLPTGLDCRTSWLKKSND